MERRRHAGNHGVDGRAVSESTRPAAVRRHDEWKPAYARFYDAHFSPAGDASAARDNGDGPLLDEVFPRCERTARALADVRDAEWLLDLLADQVAASRPCACERGPDGDPMCACVRDAAAAFQAAAAEYRGADGGARRAEETGYAHNSRHAVAADGSKDENATSAHVRAAAYHAMSALQCRCGGSTDRWNLCLLRCLLHTVFLEKVLGSYSRTSLRGLRDAETQTPCNDDRDHDRITTDGTAVDDGRTEKTRGWKLFRWLRKLKSDAKSPQKVKCVQGRVHRKMREPRATPTAGQSRWSLLGWLCPKTTADSTAPTRIRNTPSRTRPMELRLKKRPELKTSVSSSSSRSLCLHVLSM